MASLEQAKVFPRVDLHGAVIRRTDWSGAVLRRANLTGADCSGATFQGVDFKDARLVRTILRGADLTGAVNLTIDQLATAIIDDDTKLPTYIDRGRLFDVIVVSQQTEGAWS